MTTTWGDLVRHHRSRGGLDVHSRAISSRASFSCEARGQPDLLVAYVLSLLRRSALSCYLGSDPYGW